MGRLDRKVAVITGGAGGIGRAAGKRFVAEGAQVLLVDRDADALERACEEIGTSQSDFLVGDVASAADNQRMIERASDKFGGVDILLANAGIEGSVTGIADCEESDFDQVLAVNVKGPFLGIKAAIPAMTARKGGSIIVTSSVAGVRGSPSIAPYVASKHAVVGLVRSAAREMASQGIRVNCVNPGPVETRMIHSLEKGLSPDAPERVRAWMEENIPLRRYATPDEIANVMLFLASDEAAYITGAVHMADGGMTA